MYARRKTKGERERGERGVGRTEGKRSGDREVGKGVGRREGRKEGGSKKKG